MCSPLYHPDGDSITLRDDLLEGNDEVRERSLFGKEFLDRVVVALVDELFREPVDDLFVFSGCRY